jgi:hypothetical protein
VGDYSNFIASIKSYAFQLYRETGILPSVSISQAVLESGGGTSSLATTNNNLFGIKGSGSGGSVSLPTQEYANGSYYSTNGNFAAYNSVGDSFSAYGDLLTKSSRYAGVVEADNSDSALTALGKSGYATDPTYTSKLKSIVSQYNLTQLDNAAKNQSSILSRFDVVDVTGKGVGASSGSNYQYGENSSGGIVDQVFSKIGEFFRNAGIFIVGGLLILLGIYFLFGSDTMTLLTGGNENG